MSAFHGGQFWESVEHAFEEPNVINTDVLDAGLRHPLKFFRRTQKAG